MNQETPILDELDEPPVRKSAQRLRWLYAAFEEQVRTTSNETGVAYLVDQSKLAEAFAEWLREFLAQKPTREQDNEAFVGFAAGLMLKTLIARNPLKVASMPDGADDSRPEYFWPVGFLLVSFCLGLRGRVIAEDFAGSQSPSDDLDDVGVWWSFKENMDKDPSLAMAFLDHFASGCPAWDQPGIFGREGHR